MEAENEEDAMVQPEELENAPRLISIPQAAKKSGINRQTIHRALPRIKHVRWDQEEGRQGVVLLFEDSFNSYVERFRPRPKRSGA